MRFFRVLAVMMLVVPSVLFAQSITPEAKAIRAMMDNQVADWNRGDMDAFVKSYKNSPDILFMGAQIAKGYDQMVVRYRTAYSTPEKMGKLTFSMLEVQPLDAHFATVTGHFHLDRTPAGGGNAGGHFLLVVEKTLDGWKIVRDSTTAEPTK